MTRVDEPHFYEIFGHPSRLQACEELCPFRSVGADDTCAVFVLEGVREGVRHTTADLLNGSLYAEQLCIFIDMNRHAVRFAHRWFTCNESFDGVSGFLPDIDADPNEVSRRASAHPHARRG